MVGISSCAGMSDPGVNTGDVNCSVMALSSQANFDEADGESPW